MYFKYRPLTQSHTVAHGWDDWAGADRVLVILRSLETSPGSQPGLRPGSHHPLKPFYTVRRCASQIHFLVLPSPFILPLWFPG